MGYKFIKTLDPDNKFDGVSVTFEIPSNDLTIPELVDYFEDFLRACSFSFKGEFELVYPPLKDET